MPDRPRILRPDGATARLARRLALPLLAICSNVGKLQLISRKVHGARATLVLQAPAAGRLTLSGAGVSKVTREATKAERMTIVTSLTKARAAALRKHHAKHTSVVLTVAFAPVRGGGASNAVTRVTLR